MQALSKETDDFKIIEQYIINGLQDSMKKQQGGFGYYNFENEDNKFLSNIYAVERKGEKQRFNEFMDSRKNTKKNSMLLWHGTKSANLVGILQTGFRVAPCDVSRSGNMFGDGLYFADRSDKAYRYTSDNNYYSRSNNKKDDYRYMLLCEVLLGNCKSVDEVKDFSTVKNIDSIKGVGTHGPDSKKNIYLSNGCRVPIGEVIELPKEVIKKVEPKKTTNSLGFGSNAVFGGTQNI